MFPGLSRIYGRWNRSGVAPRWFYVFIGAGFEVLAIVGVVRGAVAVAIAAAVVGLLAIAGGFLLNALLGSHANADGSER